MNKTAWTKLFRHLDAPKLKAWYKKLIHRQNRRAAKRDPEHLDKRPDPWSID